MTHTKLLWSKFTNRSAAVNPFKPTTREQAEMMQDTWTVQDDVSPEQRAYEATLPPVKDIERKPF